MPGGFVGYDPERLVSLRVRSERALEALRLARSDDPGAVGAMSAVRSAALHLETMVLPSIDRVLVTAAMSGWTPSAASIVGLAGVRFGTRREGLCTGASDDPVYSALVAALATGRRGELVELLAGPDGAEWAALVAAGSLRIDDRSRRFFDVEPHPGAGFVVLDLFIPESRSFVVEGDGRGHADPIFGDVGFDDSRLLMVLDLETGRGVVQFDDSCLEAPVIGHCAPARDISMSDSWWPDSIPSPWNDNPLRGGAIDNEVIVKSSDDAVMVELDILNSVIALGSVDTRLWLVYDDDDDVEAVKWGDEYPSVGIHQYRPGAEPDLVVSDRVLRHDSEGITEVAPDMVELAAELALAGASPLTFAATKIDDVGSFIGDLFGGDDIEGHVDPDPRRVVFDTDPEE